jgi:hypothetical protein
LIEKTAKGLRIDHIVLVQLLPFVIPSFWPSDGRQVDRLFVQAEAFLQAVLLDQQVLELHHHHE